MRTNTLGAALAAVALMQLQACTMLAPTHDVRLIHSAYTVIGAGGDGIARVLTAAEACPAMTIDGRMQPMQMRVPAGIEAVRANAPQKDNKPADFALATCELALPKGSGKAQVGNLELPLPAREYRRIVLIADTGCRMKQSEDYFQDCGDSKTWPLAEVAQTAAAQHPDLVIHIGDIHYRESPCPDGMAGCAGSPWGDGSAAWEADFFRPVRPLLQAAPWVFVRGNHETCARAGRGWFRFMDALPWTAARSCNDPARDGAADFSVPYSVPLDAGTQLIVFDSGRASEKTLHAGEPVFEQYAAAFRQVDRLALQAPHSFFLSHHPVLAYGLSKKAGEIKPGNEALQSVMRVQHPDRLFAPGIDLAMHGHVHLFEALSFQGDLPATLVVGNAGSANEGKLPQPMPADALVAPGALLAQFVTRSTFGFARLDRVEDHWRLTEMTVQGEPVTTCELAGSTLHCSEVRSR